MRTRRARNTTIGLVLITGAPASAQAPTTRAAREATATPTLAVPAVPSGDSLAPPGSRRILRPTRPGVRRTGAARAAKPLSGAGKGLPEGYRVAGREGGLTRDGEWWLFTPDPTEEGPPLPPLRLLPSRTLEHIEAAARRGRDATRFRLSGMVTEYRSTNYLALTRALLAGVGPAEATPAVKPVTTQATTQRASGPAPSDVLKLLQQDKPARPLPLKSAERAPRRSVPDDEAEGGGGRALPDGTILVDRVGRLVRGVRGWMFVFESAAATPAEAPVRILPSRLLETMEAASAGGTEHISFVISGEVLSYQRQSFLLPRKVLTRRRLGNFR